MCSPEATTVDDPHLESSIRRSSVAVPRYPSSGTKSTEVPLYVCSPAGLEQIGILENGRVVLCRPNDYDSISPKCIAATLYVSSSIRPC
ncbi:hypothetical protein QJS10_CPA09g00566 [Acorus calamus]|uniref:Uncharacterized protein n=1 Tax=Acorus calamus TaxID=4465 RepID=A0AAV9E8Q0_ACOCL|nr:hypothetical protein QJS10_CPA09g00566 [Acorus calamus]